MTKGQRELLRQLPAVGVLLNSPEAKALEGQYAHSLVAEAIRQAINNARQRILAGEDGAPSVPALVQEAEQILVRQLLGRMPKVINATGIIVHTGLGRSLLSESAIARLIEVSRHHCALEVDVETGERGSRDTRIARLLCQLTGAEAATVVNNNAAAVLLTLNTIAEGKEVIVSRGELVEIGGSFRIPDVMRKSGAKLVEVGTTNKTRIEDYERAITENTALLLKVHKSNFSIVGFTEEVSLEELVELGRRRNLPVMEDLGSGALVDVSKFGLAQEPLVQDSVEAGADVVTFSGDKLLGGPQGGLIVGKKEYVQRIRKNPLYRAVRVDKLTLAALEATLLSYFDEEKAIAELPTLHAISHSESEVRAKARRLARQLKKALKASNGFEGELKLRRGFSQVGGGALPTENLPTWLVALRPTKISVEEAAQRLRTGNPSVFCRIYKEELLFDLRTVREIEIGELAQAILRAFC